VDLQKLRQEILTLEQEFEASLAALNEILQALMLKKTLLDRARDEGFEDV
jgi:hypothetical protein